MAFGLSGQAPLALGVPGGQVLLRGAADKVDILRDGTVIVTDVKTGSPRNITTITDQNHRWERQRHDPALAGFLTLTEPEALSEEAS